MWGMPYFRFRSQGFSLCMRMYCFTQLAGTVLGQAQGTKAQSAFAACDRQGPKSCWLRSRILREAGGPFDLKKQSQARADVSTLPDGYILGSSSVSKVGGRTFYMQVSVSGRNSCSIRRCCSNCAASLLLIWGFCDHNSVVVIISKTNPSDANGKDCRTEFTCVASVLKRSQLLRNIMVMLSHLRVDVTHLCLPETSLKLIAGL